MNKKILYFISIIVMVIFLTTISVATSYSADISVALQSEHQGMVCIYCHVTRGFSIGVHEDESDSCDLCHVLRDNKQLLDAAHSKICDKCHTIPTNSDEYHQLHNNVAHNNTNETCDKCHESWVKPSVAMSNCAGCHGEAFAGSGNIHDIHKSKLDQICTACHGTRPGISPVVIGDVTSLSGSQKGQTLTQQVYAKTIDYRKYTLYEIIKKLFGSL
jgi:hypothetical protein